MNTASKLIVGLDIGTTKVCAIVGQLDENGKIKVLGLGKAPSQGGVARGMVTNIPKTVEAIKKAVDQASQMSKVKIEVVHVGIAGHHIRSFQQNMPRIRENSEVEISSDELDAMQREMMRMNVEPGSSILHVLPQEYKVDNEITEDPLGNLGWKIDCTYHIITGKVNEAKKIEKCVKDAGLEVSDIIVEPIASASAVLSDEELEAGVAILDIGGGTSDLAIFYDKKIRHTAVIPFGGDSITKDIMEAFGLLEKQAENLKVQKGCALPEACKTNEVYVIESIPGRKPKEISAINLAKVINARVSEIFEMVYDEIRISGYHKKLGAGIILTGGGAQLNGIAQLLEYSTGYEVNLGYPNRNLSKGLVDEVKSPMFATGIGLVSYGLQNYQSDNNQAQNTHKATTSSSQQTKKTSEGNIFGSFMKLKEGLNNWLNDNEDMGDFK